MLRTKYDRSLFFFEKSESYQLTMAKNSK